MRGALVELREALAESPGEARAAVPELASIEALLGGAAELLRTDAEWVLPSARGRALRRCRAALLLFLEILKESDKVESQR